MAFPLLRKNSCFLFPAQHDFAEEDENAEEDEEPEHLGSAGKVGVVDTQRVQKEAPLAKQYVEKHEQKVQEINKKLAEEKLSMSDEDFQKEQQKQKQELDIYSAGLQRQFKSDLDQKLAEIAKDKEVGIIVDKRAVPNGGIDMTDEVIAKLQ